MNLKMMNRKIAVFVLFITVIGCGQSGNRLMDQSSVNRDESGPEYIDFSDLKLSEVADRADEEPLVETTPVSSVGTGSQAEVVSPTVPPKVSTGIGTVYYLPVYGEKRNCPKNEISSVKDVQDNELTQLCKDEVYNCAMQGSCFYLGRDGVRLFAFKKMVSVQVPNTKKTISQPRFTINKSSTLCPQGMGAHNVCLDPYRSVAADPKFHKIGDVVYVPKLRDQKMPDGEIHDGYLIVRDTGGHIIGEGRFDFFIGFDDYRGHVFSKLNLADKKTSQFEYLRVPEEIAAKVRLARAFPMAPKKVQENAVAEMKEALNAKTGLIASKDNVEFFKMKWDLF